MPGKTYTWISLWFLITAPIILWDVCYCFMRPRSFKGGDLHWIWKPYEWYENVDYLYGPHAYAKGDGFTNAQSTFNIIETFLNVYYLYLAHVKAWPPAALVGFAAALMTLSKTGLYWLQEYFCNFCATGQNDFWTLFTLWIVPNGLWIIIPALIVRQLGRDLIQSIEQSTSAAQKPTVSGQAKVQKTD